VVFAGQRDAERVEEGAAAAVGGLFQGLGPAGPDSAVPRGVGQAGGGSANVTGNSRASITVCTGTHTVATTVYVDAAGTLANWESDFALYTP
jgi:hypothetical protein